MKKLKSVQNVRILKKWLIKSPNKEKVITWWFQRVILSSIWTRLNYNHFFLNFCNKLESFQTLAEHEGLHWAMRTFSKWWWPWLSPHDLYGRRRGWPSMAVLWLHPRSEACIYPVYNISPEDGENLFLGVWVGFSDWLPSDLIWKWKHPT